MFTNLGAFRGAILSGLLAMFAVACATRHTGETPMSAELTQQTEPATQVLCRYEAALNAKDVDTIASLYMIDGVFMAQHRNPTVGRPAIAGVYREIFGMITLEIVFQIDEVVVVSPTVAYARTRSSGKTTILATGDQVSEGNQELFVLIREEGSGDWKIGRYIFSTTQPPRG